MPRSKQDFSFSRSDGLSETWITYGCNASLKEAIFSRYTVERLRSDVDKTLSISSTEKEASAKRSIRPERVCERKLGLLRRFRAVHGSQPAYLRTSARPLDCVRDHVFKRVAHVLPIAPQLPRTRRKATLPIGAFFFSNFHHWGLLRRCLRRSWCFCRICVTYFNVANTFISCFCDFPCFSNSSCEMIRVPTEVTSPDIFQGRPAVVHANCQIS